MSVPNTKGGKGLANIHHTTHIPRQEGPDPQDMIWIKNELTLNHRENDPHFTNMRWS